MQMLLDARVAGGRLPGRLLRAATAEKQVVPVRGRNAFVPDFQLGGAHGVGVAVPSPSPFSLVHSTFPRALSSPLELAAGASAVCLRCAELPWTLLLPS